MAEKTIGTDVNQFEAGDMKGDMGRKPKALTALVRNCNHVHDIVLGGGQSAVDGNGDVLMYTYEVTCYMDGLISRHHFILYIR